MLKRREAIGIAILGMFVLAGFLSIIHYIDTVYALDRAAAYFSRAEAAGFSDEMIEYIERGRSLIPKSGNPVWWFPTSATDFEAINRDLESILKRARILLSLPKDSTAYQQGMDDLREKLVTIRGQLKSATPFMFISLQNLAYSAAWIIALLYLIRLASKRPRG